MDPELARMLNEWLGQRGGGIRQDQGVPPSVPSAHETDFPAIPPMPLGPQMGRLPGPLAIPPVPYGRGVGPQLSPELLRRMFDTPWLPNETHREYRQDRPKDK